MVIEALAAHGRGQFLHSRLVNLPRRHPHHDHDDLYHAAFPFSVLEPAGISAGSVALGLTIIRPKLAAGTKANSKVRLGLIGCGNPGPWIARLFQEHGGYQFVAVADYFANRAAKATDLLNIPAAAAFSGLSGYRRVLDAKPDAVVIESTPYFHPEQAMTAVEAGCHVYSASRSASTCPAA